MTYNTAAVITATGRDRARRLRTTRTIQHGSGSQSVYQRERACVINNNIMWLECCGRRGQRSIMWRVRACIMLLLLRNTSSAAAVVFIIIFLQGRGGGEKGARVITGRELICGPAAEAAAAFCCPAAFLNNNNNRLRRRPRWPPTAAEGAPAATTGDVWSRGFRVHTT